jgi:hypothetical protein
MHLTQAQKKALLAMRDDGALVVGCRALSCNTFRALARLGLAVSTGATGGDLGLYGEARLTDRGREVARTLRAGGENSRGFLLATLTTAELVAELERRQSLPPGPFGPAENAGTTKQGK